MAQVEAPAGEAPYPKALKNGPLVEVVPGEVWCLEGRFPMTSLIATMRTMTIVRSQRGELAVFSSIRVDDATLSQIRALGKIKAVVKVGGGHGRDDAWWVAQTGAEYWAHPRFEADRAVLKNAKIAVDGAPGPFPSLTAFVFADLPVRPESAWLFNREGRGPNFLIVCDAMQSYASVPNEDVVLSNLSSNFLGKLVLYMMGFTVRCVSALLSGQLRWPRGLVLASCPARVKTRD